MPIEFPSNLLLGHADIDADHREIHQRIGTLLDAAAAKRSKDELAGFLDYLIDYAVAHFQREKELMQATSYPLMLDHVSQHEEFWRTAFGLREEFKLKGHTSLLYVQVSSTVVEWLKNHISRDDKLLADYVRARTDT